MLRLARRLHHNVGVKKTERRQKKMATYPRIDELCATLLRDFSWLMI
jgi:hypothetical protein